MPDQGLPKQRPVDLVLFRCQFPRPNQRGSSWRRKYRSIRRFKNYREVESYARRNSGGGYRSYPGGADYPVITYTKYNDPYNDMNYVERQLRSESWDAFAASVYQVIVKRVEVA